MLKNNLAGKTTGPTRESRIKGIILCSREDEYGEIIVADEGNRRSLFFGEGVVQSTIQTDRPDLLLEDYNEAMMSGLIFINEPRSVLLIGLGGCSLVHFLMKALPDLTIDIVEIRQQVIDLSREFFLLPTNNPNLRIVHASGGDFVRRQAADSRNFDMIIVDAFDESGPAVSLLERDFLNACRKRLNENGVFIINLWHSPAHNFHALYSSIQDAFENNTLKLLLTESYRNAVAFGFKNPSCGRKLPDYRSVAAELRRKHNINFPRYLRQLYWQNFNAHDQ